MSLEQPASAAEERRLESNRRKHNFWNALCSKNRRRRNTGRRDQDSVGYVDFYDRKTWLLAFSILALSILDAVFTGIEVSSGRAREANPVMNATLARGGVYGFFGIKAALTALPLAILVMHKEWPLARVTVRICLWSYVLVVLYHIYLIFGCSA